MARTVTERTSGVLETHRGYDTRLRLFYVLVAVLVLVLAGGLAYRQLISRDVYREKEKVQTQRRLIIPAPRGNIFDRNGELLVGNRPRYGLVLYLDQQRAEVYHEYLRIRRNYRETEDKDIPSAAQLEQIARYTVAQRALDGVNAILGRDMKVDPEQLKKHHHQQLLLPFPLIEDLTPEEFSKLLETLPARSPLQLYASSARYYPFGSSASHTLGYVGVTEDLNNEDLPGEDLTTFTLKGTLGRDGLEKQYDDILRGEPGGTIFRVDPAGYRVNPPIQQRPPIPGHDLTCSIDIGLQMVAEDALGDEMGAAVALDVRTGEVLVLASKPDYDLSKFSPYLTQEAAAEIEANHAWANRALSSFYPPGSTFKILTSIAALRRGTITPDDPIADCEGFMMISGHKFVCENGNGHHGEILLRDAISESCDIYYYTAGIRTSAAEIAAEARRFHLDERTGIDLPGEPKRMIVPDPEWKQRTQHEPWFPGDTANMSIGQGYVLMNPLEMACFAASVARDETTTTPSLIHDPEAPPLHSERIGLTPEQRQALLEGMERCTTEGTASNLSKPPLAIPGLRIAGKTGTAQIPEKKNVAWFICFAPLEHPEIAVAVAVEGDTPGESYAGNAHAAPIADLIIKKYFEQKKTGIRKVTTSTIGGVAAPASGVSAR